MVASRAGGATAPVRVGAALVAARCCHRSRSIPQRAGRAPGTSVAPRRRPAIAQGRCHTAFATNVYGSDRPGSMAVAGGIAVAGSNSAIVAGAPRPFGTHVGVIHPLPLSTQVDAWPPIANSSALLHFRWEWAVSCSISRGVNPAKAVGSPIGQHRRAQACPRQIQWDGGLVMSAYTAENGLSPLCFWCPY